MKSNENNGKSLKLLGFMGLGVLALAFAAGVWGFFGFSNAGLKSRVPSSTSHSSIPHNKQATDQSSKIPKKQMATPVVLIDAGEYSENIYDLAKTEDWENAAKKLISLKRSITSFSASRVNSETLIPTLKNLETSVATKNKDQALQTSNHLTLLVADLTAKFDPKVPIEVTKLDYFGREIEIWAGRKDQARLESTVKEMRQTWDAVKERVKTNNGSKEAAKFEELVRQTEAAGAITQYAKLATPILDEVDNLEKVFG